MRQGKEYAIVSLPLDPLDLLDHSDPMNNLYLFTGENFQALNEKLSFWKKEFEKKHSETNIEQFNDVSQKDIPAIVNAIESQPFLADKRMIIVRDIPQSAEKKKKLELDHLQDSLEPVCTRNFIRGIRLSEA